MLARAKLSQRVVNYIINATGPAGINPARLCTGCGIAHASHPIEQWRADGCCKRSRQLDCRCACGKHTTCGLWRTIW
jgi:hypothetical protein